jgi:hypothetical protein
MSLPDVFVRVSGLASSCHSRGVLEARISFNYLASLTSLREAPNGSIKRAEPGEDVPRFLEDLSLQRNGSRLAAAVPTAASTHAKACCPQLRLYSRVARPGTTGENRATKCLIHSPLSCRTRVRTVKIGLSG